MKTPSTTLYVLIQSMTASEKRLFRLQNTEESKLMLLFDIVEQMNEYNESLVKEKLNDASFAKNLKVHKNRLYQLVLNFLAQNPTHITISRRIRNNIDIIEVLIQKKLFKLAYEHIQKTKFLCIDNEEYELLLLVLAIEVRQETYFKEKDGISALEQMQDVNSIIDNYLRYAQINHELVARRFQNHKSLEDPCALREELAKKHLIKEGKEIIPRSSIAQRMRSHCKSILHELKFEFDLAAEETRNIVLLLEANNNIIREKPNQYFSALYNHMCACCTAERYDEVLYYKAKQFALVEENTFLEPYLIYTYSLLVDMYKKQSQYQAAYHLFSEKISLDSKALEKYKGYPIDYFFSRMVEVLMYLHKKDELLDLINLLNQELADTTEHLLVISWKLQTIVYINYREWILLSSWLETVKKRIQRKKIKNLLLSKIIALAQKLVIKPIEEHSKYYEKHLAQLEAFDADNQRYLLYFETFFKYKSWIKCTIKC